MKEFIFNKSCYLCDKFIEKGKCSIKKKKKRNESGTKTIEKKIRKYGIRKYTM